MSNPNPMPTSAKTQDAVRRTSCQIASGKYVVTAGVWDVNIPGPRYSVVREGREVFACSYASQVSAWLMRTAEQHCTDAEMRDVLALSAPASPPPEYFDVATKQGVSVFIGGPQRIGDANKWAFTSLLANWDSIRPKNAPHRLRLFAEVGAADHNEVKS